MLNFLKNKTHFNFNIIKTTKKLFNFEQFRERPKRHFVLTYRFLVSKDQKEVDLKFNNKQCSYIP